MVWKMLTTTVGGIDEEKTFFNTYIIIETFHQLGQVHYATLCFVQLKEPCQMLVQPSEEGALQVNRCKVSKFCFNLWMWI